MKAIALCALAVLALQLPATAVANAEEPVEATPQPPPAAEPGTDEGTRPPGWDGAYRVVVNRTDVGTAAALSADGWLVTALSLFSACRADDSCRISVQDGERNVWAKADLIATDVRHGIALLRTREALPSAVEFPKPGAKTQQPLHAFAFADKERVISTGNVLGTRTVRLAGDPPANAKLAVSDMHCQSCSNGTPIFSLDGKMVGVYMGVVEADDAHPDATVILGAPEVRDFYKKNRKTYDDAHPAKK